jgi:hypothetical protein
MPKSEVIEWEMGEHGQSWLCSQTNSNARGRKEIARDMMKIQVVSILPTLKSFTEGIILTSVLFHPCNQFVDDCKTSTFAKLKKHAR